MINLRMIFPKIVSRQKHHSDSGTDSMSVINRPSANACAIPAPPNK